jgi:hypothetical protein
LEFAGILGGPSIIEIASVRGDGGLKSLGPRRFSGCTKFAARASKIPDPLRKIR